MSNLFIVATPIGNLNDISKRAIDTLKRVDFILCEDTIRSKKILNYFKINTPTISYHQHSDIKKTDYILSLLIANKDLALISDAGTPGIADPGNKLIELILRKFENKIQITPIPGPSAIMTIASISGFNMDKFLFLGFPPSKHKRAKFFEQIKTSQYPVIIFESPYRILRTLKELPQNRQIVVGRELTKKFETIYRGTPKQILERIKNKDIKGEFVVVVSNKE